MSELKTDHGYTILSWRDTKDFSVSEYVMPTAEKGETAKERKAINALLKKKLMEASPVCSYLGGGTVRLQVDHMTAHNHDDKGEHSEKTFNYYAVDIT